MSFYVILCVCNCVGMHLASFDNGSTAALEMFAEELLDLWNNPIIIDGISHYVVIGQILMDDKGRESFCGVQGATSLAGCNLCHFEGRTFAKRTVFDGARRYCKHNDTTRLKDSQKNVRNNLHFSFDERRSHPKKRKYADYVASANVAAAENARRPSGTAAHEGVKKLWVLDILPYAEWVHWTEDLMHCFFNIIKDGLNSMRPTNSGDKKLYQHQNRTTAPVVIAACLEEGNAILCRFMSFYACVFYVIICLIMYNNLCRFTSFYAYIIGIHEHLGESTNAPWIFTKKECIESDDLMRLVIGSYTYEDCPQGVMKAGKANNSHDTIFWATVYARWCFRSKGGPVYTENLLEIFDIMAALNATRLNVRDIKENLRPRLIKALVRRSGLLPPTESMLTLHELVHICDQVDEVGVPRVSSLYKFERMNHILKDLLQNRGKGKTLLCLSMFFMSFINYVHFMTFYVFLRT
jgi:hypothetical protein